MHHRFIVPFLLLLTLISASCQKWEDKPGQDLGLKNHYCNNPIAINYNFGFPGIEDSTVCIFPSDPFVGSYTYRDSLYYPESDTAVAGALLDFSISARNRSQLSLDNFCSSGSKLLFTANRYYRAASDSIIGQGLQTGCRSQDTLSGYLDYRSSDSSLYLEFKVVSDTGITTHKGRAYKKK